MLTVPVPEFILLCALSTSYPKHQSDYKCKQKTRCPQRTANTVGTHRLLRRVSQASLKLTMQPRVISGLPVINHCHHSHKAPRITGEQNNGQLLEIEHRASCMLGKHSEIHSGTMNTLLRTNGQGWPPVVRGMRPAYHHTPARALRLEMWLACSRPKLRKQTSPKPVFLQVNGLQQSH